MVQLKPFCDSKVPKIVSHRAGNILDDDREGKDIFVQDEKISVVDENGKVQISLQVKKYLINSIIWSDSSVEIEGVISSIECVGKIFLPK